MSAESPTAALIGANGQLGSAFASRLGVHALSLSRQQCDLETLNATTAEQWSRQIPDSVHTLINCAAYNQVDQAETDLQEAFAGNAIGPGELAKLCELKNWKLVHISSDYVFGQMQSLPFSGWKETDLPQPGGVYATSKLAGEQLVQAANSKALILRTCGLYGRARSGGKRNFVETMRHFGKQRGAVRVVNDQHCMPTSVETIVTATLQLLKQNESGLFHCTDAGQVTWYEFACEIFQQCGMEVDVTAVPSTEYPTPAKRPHCSLLDCSKLEATIGTSLPDWKQSLSAYLSNSPVK